MSRGLARFKQSDVARAIRAAQATGAGAVEITREGTIRVTLAPAQPAAPVDTEEPDSNEAPVVL